VYLTGLPAAARLLMSSVIVPEPLGEATVPKVTAVPRLLFVAASTASAVTVMVPPSCPPVLTLNAKVAWLVRPLACADSTVMDWAGAGVMVRPVIATSASAGDKFNIETAP